MARPRKVTPDAISLASLLLARRLDLSAVYKVVMEQHALSRRSVQRVLTAARAELVAASGKPVEEHRQDAYAFYNSVVRDPATGMGLRLKAQDKLCELLGLMAPIRATVDMPGGVPIRGAMSGAVVFLPMEEPLREEPAPPGEGDDGGGGVENTPPGGEGGKTPPGGEGGKTPPGGVTGAADGPSQRNPRPAGTAS